MSTRSAQRDATVVVMLGACVVLPLGLLASSPPTAGQAAIAAVPAAATGTAGVAGPARGETTAVAGPRARSAPACVPSPLPTRAAAVLMVGLPGVRHADAAMAEQAMSLGVGGVFLAASNVDTADQVRTLVSELRARAPRPIIVATDAESGRVSVLRSVIGGGLSPRRLARQDTPEQVQELAAELGSRLKDLGVDLDLAPVVDLDDGAYNGIIGDRSFGADPETVATYAGAFRDGLSEAGVAAAVKHFPGQGRSDADTHLHPAVVDTPVKDLVSRDLVPFRRLVDQGVPVVMMNHLDYTSLGGASVDDRVPASLSPQAYALLRSTGFSGVAMTDSLGMGAVNSRWDFPAAAVRAIAAGADLAFATDGRQAERMRDALVAAVRSGSLPESRLDEAATRVARLAGADTEALTCAQP